MSCRLKPSCGTSRAPKTTNSNVRYDNRVSGLGSSTLFVIPPSCRRRRHEKLLERRKSVRGNWKKKKKKNERGRPTRNKDVKKKDAKSRMPLGKPQRSDAAKPNWYEFFLRTHAREFVIACHTSRRPVPLENLMPTFAVCLLQQWRTCGTCFWPNSNARSTPNCVVTSQRPKSTCAAK